MGRFFTVVDGWVNLTPAELAEIQAQYREERAKRRIRRERVAAELEGREVRRGERAEWLRSRGVAVAQ